MKQILCFGDSNTYGLIPGTANQRYGWGTRWTSILDDKVRTKGYRVIEEGLCGRTTVFDDPFRTERCCYCIILRGRMQCGGKTPPKTPSICKKSYNFFLKKAGFPLTALL